MLRALRRGRFVFSGHSIQRQELEMNERDRGEESLNFRPSIDSESQVQNMPAGRGWLLVRSTTRASSARLLLIAIKLALSSAEHSNTVSQTFQYRNVVMRLSTSA